MVLSLEKFWMQIKSVANSFLINYNIQSSFHFLRITYCKLSFGTEYLTQDQDYCKIVANASSGPDLCNTVDWVIM